MTLGQEGIGPFQLRSAVFTVPHRLLSGGQNRPYYHRLSRVECCRPIAVLRTCALCAAGNRLTDVGAASLATALRHPACRLTDLFLIGCHAITEVRAPARALHTTGHSDTRSPAPRGSARVPRIPSCAHFLSTRVPWCVRSLVQPFFAVSNGCE